MGWKALLLVIGVILNSLAAFAGSLTVVFLDVGEGDATYIETPRGEKVLVDSGNLVSGNRVVQFFKERGSEEIDAVIITHHHPDHIGGLSHLMRNLKVNARYDNGQPLKKQEARGIYRWFDDNFRKGNYQILMAGRHIIFGDVLIEVLSPEKLSSDWNSDSLVLKVRYGDTSFLMMGDAGFKTEKRLMDTGISLKADVLKPGHHGAGDASSGDFLDAVSPTYAVLSIDENNKRGYPDEAVIRRIKDRCIEPVMTYKEGDIVFESDGKTVARSAGRSSD